MKGCIVNNRKASNASNDNVWIVFVATASGRSLMKRDDANVREIKVEATRDPCPIPYPGQRDHVTFTRLDKDS